MHEPCRTAWGVANAGGTSEWTAQQLTEAWSVSKRLNLVGPAFEQPEYSLLAREKVHSSLGLLCLEPLHPAADSGMLMLL